jgi:hypothetical protein
MKDRQGRVGKVLLPILIIAMASLAFSASAFGSTSKVPIWTSGGSHLKFGTEVSFESHAIHGMILKWKPLGSPAEIQCEGLNASGKVENFAGGKAGTMSPGSGSFKGCILTQLGENGAEGPCHVQSEIPATFESGALVNSPFENGGLELTNFHIVFYLHCEHSTLYENVPFGFYLTANGHESQGSWPGEVKFAETAVNSENIHGTVEFSLNVNTAAWVPLPIGEETFPLPNDPGHHYWYVGGHQRRGEGPWTLAAGGSPLSVGGYSRLHIRGQHAGVKVGLSCEGTSTGAVENPVGGANGTATTTLAFSACSVAEPAGKNCVIQGGGFSTKQLSGVFASGSSPVVGFTGPKGLIGEFQITGCSVASLNTTYKLEGTLNAQPSSGSNIWEVPESLNDAGNVLLGGLTANVSGEIRAEHAGELVSAS